LAEAAYNEITSKHHNWIRASLEPDDAG
jgi:hypothetical protein